MLVPFIDLAYLFFISFISLFVLRKVANKVGLVDRPSGRKKHCGNIPLVGGISICSTLAYFLFNNPKIIPNSEIYALCIIVLTIVGALDDRFDISFKTRFAIQSILSVVMMTAAKIELLTLGDILGTGEITLGLLGYLVTILAVVGAINAFNMVDGLDGLLGGISIVAFSGLGIMLLHDGQSSLAYLCLVLVVIIVPYLFLNMGMFGLKRKIFMGDAGSMLIGFTVIWFLLLSSQNGTTPPLRPVTALWLIAIPLMDMVAIMYRRVRRGCSPFRPDREHLHHIFQRLGFNSKQTVIIICLMSSLLAGFGIYGEIYGLSEAFMFYAFIIVFFIYATVLNYIWKITSYIRKKFFKNIDYSNLEAKQ